MSRSLYSEEGNRLISTIPGTITVEDYDKWYCLYYIKNEIDALPLHKVIPGTLSIEYFDHCFKPSSVIDFAYQKDLKIEALSYLAICYRWQIEIVGNYTDISDVDTCRIPEDDLPEKLKLDDVLLWSDQDEIYSKLYLFHPRHITREFIINSYSRRNDHETW